MKRGTKEFYDVQASFERLAKTGIIGYLSSDYTKDNFSATTFYANGELNNAFRAYMAGYSAGKCAYQQ